MSATTDARDARLKRLQDATDSYVKEELDRIDTEVAVLEAVVQARRAGQGASGDAAAAASMLAQADLDWYLRGV